MNVLTLLTIIHTASASIPEGDEVLTNIDVQLLQAALSVETKSVVAMEDNVGVNSSTLRQATSTTPHKDNKCYPTNSCRQGYARLYEYCEGSGRRQSCSTVCQCGRADGGDSEGTCRNCCSGRYNRCPQPQPQPRPRPRPRPNPPPATAAPTAAPTPPPTPPSYRIFGTGPSKTYCASSGGQGSLRGRSASCYELGVGCCQAACSETSDCRFISVFTAPDTGRVYCVFHNSCNNAGPNFPEAECNTALRPSYPGCALNSGRHWTIYQKA